MPAEGVKLSDLSAESRGCRKAYVQIHLKKGRNKEKTLFRFLKVQERENSGLCRGVQLSRCCTGSADLHVCERQ